MSDSTQIATASSTTAASIDHADHTFMLLQQAVDRGTDPETLSRLLDLQERVMDRNAEQAFAASMVAVQSSISPVHRSAYNSQTRSYYARYEDMHKAIAPVYTSNGFVLMFGEEDSPLENNRRIICDVMHRLGHSRRYHIDVPIDNKGMKGTPNKTETHGAMSSASYGRRALEAMIFNVVFTDQDDDGNAAAIQEFITAQQAADLRALAQEVGADEARFLRYLRADAFESILAQHYDRAVSALEQKRNRK